MVIHMRVHGKKVKLKALEYIHKTTAQSMKETSSMINVMVMVRRPGQMVLSLKETISMARSMVKVTFSGQMVLSTKVPLLLTVLRD